MKVTTVSLTVVITVGSSGIFGKTVRLPTAYGAEAH